MHSFHRIVTYRSLAVTGILVPLPPKNPTMASCVVVASQRVDTGEKACTTVEHSNIVAPIHRRGSVTRIILSVVAVFSRYFVANRKGGGGHNKGRQHTKRGPFG